MGKALVQERDQWRARSGEMEKALAEAVLALREARKSWRHVSACRCVHCVPLLGALESAEKLGVR
jgi:hypothetical protein